MNERDFLIFEHRERIAIRLILVCAALLGVAHVAAAAAVFGCLIGDHWGILTGLVCGGGLFLLLCLALGWGIGKLDRRLLPRQDPSAPKTQSR